MPKVTWPSQPSTLYPKAKPPDYTLELLNRYQKANKLTNAQLAPLVGCKNEQAVKDKKAYGTDRWHKATVLLWAQVLHVPMGELARALEQDIYNINNNSIPS